MLDASDLNVSYIYVNIHPLLVPEICVQCGAYCFQLNTCTAYKWFQKKGNTFRSTGLNDCNELERGKRGTIKWLGHLVQFNIL